MRRRGRRQEQLQLVRAAGQGGQQVVLRQDDLRRGRGDDKPASQSRFFRRDSPTAPAVRPPTRQAYDAAHDGHFRTCPTKQTGAARNTSDPCWIYSFYATVLGPEALLPGGPVRGMPTAVLDAAFEQPFDDPAKGGCPAVTPPPQPPPRAATAAAAAARGRGHSSFGVLAPADQKMQLAYQEAARLARERAGSRLPSAVEAEAR